MSSPVVEREPQVLKIGQALDEPVDQGIQRALIEGDRQTAPANLKSLGFTTLWGWSDADRMRHV